MFRNRLFHIIKTAYRTNRKRGIVKIRNTAPVTLGLVTTAYCDEKQQEVDSPWSADSLEHEFLINTFTADKITMTFSWCGGGPKKHPLDFLNVRGRHFRPDSSERLRDALTKEICLVKQALEWGDEGTPPQHWDQLVAVRGALCDLKHNLRTLFSYMDYAEKLATTAAEISYLSGNVVASDAICERIDHACRACNTQKQLTHELQQESLELQQQAIISAPHLEEKLKNDSQNEKKQNIEG